MNKNKYFDEIEELISKFLLKIDFEKGLNIYEKAIYSENFFRDLLNALYSWNLKNINKEEKSNFPSIDLYDPNLRLAIQVTIDKKISKIRQTLNTFFNYDLDKRFSKLKFMIIGNKTFRKEISKELKNNFDFKNEEDILTIDFILKEIYDAPDDIFLKVYKIIQFYLGDLQQKNQVFTKDELFEKVTQETNNYLQKDFFEIDDTDFRINFKETLSISNILYIYTEMNLEEAILCVLNELENMNYKNTILIIKNESIWKEAQNYIENFLLIPYFKGEKVILNSNNDYIIFKKEKSNSSLELRKRTLKNLNSKLSNNYDKAYELVKRTNGNYLSIKRYFFSGDFKEPFWVNGNERILVMSLLINQWIEDESERDIKFIEKFYNKDYEIFCEDIASINNKDEKFIEKISIGEKTHYRVKDPLLAWENLSSKLTVRTLNNFLNLSKEILQEEFNTGNDYIIPILVNGILNTCVYISIKTEFKYKIDQFVLGLIQELIERKNFNLFNKYSKKFAEISPTIFLEQFSRLLEEKDYIENYYKFDYYHNVIGSFENLLQFEDFAIKTAQLTFKFIDLIINQEFITTPTPISLLHRIFNPYFNGVSIDLENKVNLLNNNLNQYSCLISELIEYFTSLLNRRTISGAMINDFPIRKSNFVQEKIPIKERNSFIYKILHILVTLVQNNNLLDESFGLLCHLPEEDFKIWIQEFNKVTINCNDIEKSNIKVKLLRNLGNSSNHYQEFDTERIQHILKLINSLSFKEKIYKYKYLEIDEVFDGLFILENINNYELILEAKINYIKQELIALKLEGLQLIDLLNIFNENNLNQFGWLYKDIISEKEAFKLINDLKDNSSLNKFTYSLLNKISDDKKLEIIGNEFTEQKNLDLFGYIVFKLSLENFITLEKKLPENTKSFLWKTGNIPCCELPTKEISELYLNGLLNNNNYDLFSYYLKHCFNFYTIEEIIVKINNLINRSKKENINIRNYNLLCVLENLENNSLKTNKLIKEISKIEIELLPVPFSNSPIHIKCLRKLIEEDPKYYVKLISFLYTSDKNLELKRKISFLIYYLRFFPGYSEGKINNNKLKKWIDSFKILMKKEKLDSLSPSYLGKILASFSSNYLDSPPELVCQIIEQENNQDLIRTYRMKILDRRGIHTRTSGYEEKEIANTFKKISKELEIIHPIISKIYLDLSNDYFSASYLDRVIDENYYS